MDKNGGGFWDNPFGGLFDFDQDGKEDFAEMGIGFGILEEIDKEDSPSDDGDIEDDLGLDDDPDFRSDDSDDNSWRVFCEDGFEWDVDPEDYETEEEYEKALMVAKSAWRDTCEDRGESDLDPEDFDGEEYQDTELDDALDDASEDGVLNISLGFSDETPAHEDVVINEADYPNKRRYNAAYALANEFLYDDEDEWNEKARCRFIVEQADTVLAANYLSHRSGFLYAQAVKDNFALPISLPNEDETREFEFEETICKIAKRDIRLSFKVWSWCLEQFLPYARYDKYAPYELTNAVIDGLYSFPDDYKIALVRYMDGNPDFRHTVTCASVELADALPELTAAAIKEGLLQTADALFADGLNKADSRWREINKLTEGVIHWCQNDEELESVEYFRDRMLPLVKAIDQGMVQDEIEEWEKDIAEYIDQVESECEQYAFTRRNAWRANVPDGEKYNLTPRYYDTEAEYLEALDEAKYGWRKRYEGWDNCGLDPGEYETQEVFREALWARKEERRKRRIPASAHMPDPAAFDDEEIYTYCGVAFPHSERVYHYRIGDLTIKIGDNVIVPVGDKEAAGTVVSVGQYKRLYVPYPVEKTKQIFGKSEQ